MSDQARDLWHDLLGIWDVDPTVADRTFEEMVKTYSGPRRSYHTLGHVMEVLATVDSLASHAKNLNAVKLAAWLHDVSYDSKAADNEERSAAYAERLKGKGTGTFVVMTVEPLACVAGRVDVALLLGANRSLSVPPTPHRRTACRAAHTAAAPAVLPRSAAD